ncbi:type-2 ice-structuring protein-like [Mya arenaria]|uniref:type-2 ice-structuring protein-like n=1 Tax=Mya arenaria TaxID=6604 RepID=UPI0022E81E43|nr:type-2 ice-structuring protein-like [Mya arenaria]
MYAAMEMTQYQKDAGTISGNNLDHTSGKLDKSREQCQGSNLTVANSQNAREENCEAVRYGPSTSECQMFSDVIPQWTGNDANWLIYQKIKGCPEGWVAFYKSCYFFSTNLANWNNAEDHCISLGGHLATVRTIEEHQFIVENRPLPNRFLWIGGKRSSTVVSTFVWANGEPWDFHHWSPFEPSKEEEECVDIYNYKADPAQYGDTWNDRMCSELDPFVCEKLVLLG